MAETETSRPLRICDVCGKIDNHPRHQFLAGADEFPVNDDHVNSAISSTKVPAGAKAQLIREIQDTTLQQRHMDCCADVGCPDGTCAPIIKSAGTKRGLELVAHITKGK